MIRRLGRNVCTEKRRRFTGTRRTSVRNARPKRRRREDVASTSPADTQPSVESGGAGIQSGMQSYPGQNGAGVRGSPASVGVSKKRGTRAFTRMRPSYTPYWLWPISIGYANISCRPGTGVSLKHGYGFKGTKNRQKLQNVTPNPPIYGLQARHLLRKGFDQSFLRTSARHKPPCCPLFVYWDRYQYFASIQWV